MKSSLILRILPVVISFVLFTAGCEKEKSGLPVDGDGNVYDTVVIGTQVWLKENLKTTKYNDGRPIPNVTDNDKWASMTSASYCWYNNNPAYKDNYGALYNWYAARGNICPVGWHVPSKEEWETLQNYLIGKYGTDGGVMKDIKFWSLFNNPYDTNKSGFSARPGGERDRYARFSGIGQIGYWWTYSKDEYSDLHAWRVYVYYSNMLIVSWPREAGLSVRCVKNN